MNLMYLVNYKGNNGYLNKMSRVRFHGIKALGKLVDVTYWGINWRNYNNNISTLLLNILSKQLI